MEIGIRREKMVFENLMALWIAVEKQCPQEVAFKYLDRYIENGPDFKQMPKFRWTLEDMQDVFRLRHEGVSDEEISSYYGVKKTTLQSVICRKRKEVRA
jgi:hypothetical protein